MPSLSCYQLSPAALLLAFYLLPSLLITTAKIVKLFSEPLVIFDPLSKGEHTVSFWGSEGSSSAPPALGAGPRRSPQNTAGLATISTATTMDCSSRRSPGHWHLVLGVNSLRHLWPLLGDFGDILRNRLSKYRRGKSGTLPPARSKHANDGLSSGSAGEDPRVRGSQAQARCRVRAGNGEKPLYCPLLNSFLDFFPSLRTICLTFLVSW